MADLHHFYHIYADGEWREPVKEHFEALKTSGLAEQDGVFHSVSALWEATRT